ncbi:hypothetical protein BAUCODRAFT_125424 [Baudoinia panamericana UAMH 10762]|uniref:Major facilitator superfamily (MFS) profile domain-containing protein n=1 Tax=Baudoinia panamericana (strain UAMH 10762) TaxID=717646 RepID=M2N4F1_BAUPA|nr:uncharacterized protein BAUCODRAFT_125424 [Baudoinia panamericana UAMH 10762]EMC93575.1 hypothetical protein BAUCODRAFT_125424 [Baudoinia panamericana UAMH 10762]
MATNASIPLRPRNYWARLLWPEDQHERYRSLYDRVSDYAEAVDAIVNGVDNVDPRDTEGIRKPEFKWEVFWVAALGFLTESYCLFESNVILPPISFVWWPGHGHRLEAAFNLATLGCSIVGQLAFGVAVDIYGRRTLYGVELIIVVISTLGLLQCSNGFTDPVTGRSTWTITPWLIFWRSIMGIGVGAEYPLSAVIASEWSPTASRARLMASVFLMQPVGQLFAYAVGLLCLASSPTGGVSQVSVDKMWRTVVGSGAAPAMLAVFFRRSIPESWRFDYFVTLNPTKASHDLIYVFGWARRSPSDNAAIADTQARSTQAVEGSGSSSRDINDEKAPAVDESRTGAQATGIFKPDGTKRRVSTLPKQSDFLASAQPPRPFEPPPGVVNVLRSEDPPKAGWQFKWSIFWQYILYTEAHVHDKAWCKPFFRCFFHDRKNLKVLVGTSSAWFFLDFAL